MIYYRPTWEWFLVSQCSILLRLGFPVGNRIGVYIGLIVKMIKFNDDIELNWEATEMQSC